jgi:hypothetical protein
MFKQFLLAATVAASTLVVGGTISAQAASASTPCSVDKAGNVITPQSTARRCVFRERRGMRCKFCRRHGEWQREWCSERRHRDDYGRRHHDDWNRHRDGMNRHRDHDFDRHRDGMNRHRDFDR